MRIGALLAWLMLLPMAAVADLFPPPGQAVAVGEAMAWLIDEDGALSFAEVAALPDQAFTRAHTDQIKFGRSGYVVWLRYRPPKQPPQKAPKQPPKQPSGHPLFLNLGHLISGGSLLVRRIDAYVPQANGTIDHQIWGFDVLERPVTGFNEPVFTLQDAAGPVLIRIAPYAGKAVTVRPTLMDQVGALKKSNADSLIIGIVLGVLALVASASFIIFTANGHASFRDFSAFALAMAVYFWTADLQGPAAFRAVIDPVFWVVEPAILAVAAVAGLQFLRNFLDLPTRYPRLDMAALALIIAAIAAPVIGYALGLPAVAGRSSMLVFIILPAFALLSTLLTWRRDSLAALLLLCGAGVFMVAVILHGLADLARVPVGPLIANLPRIGVLMFAGMIVLTLGISSLERLKRRDEDKLSLEEAVRERTIDLERARNEARAADAAKTRFLANISHEIRTPLNGIIGMVEGMSASGLNSRQKEQADTIRHSSNLMLTLLDDLLDYAAIEADRITLRRQRFHPRAFIDETARFWQASAGNKDITFVVDNRMPADLCVEGDPARLRQIVNNLLSNAIKFTDRGSVTLTATASEYEDGWSRLVILVADTGVGIPEEALGRLFEPFTQEAASAHSRGGSGLGLAISRRLAKRMGGDIRLESVLGRGTKATVTLILANVTSLLPLATENEPDVAGGPAKLSGGRRVRVLVVEDNALNRAVVETYLPLPDYACHFAALAGEAVDMIQASEFDVVLMDLRLPDMDGLEAVRRIRRLTGPAALVPVIMLTADAGPARRAAAEQAGANAFLEKPVQREALVAAVRTMVQPSFTWGAGRRRSEVS